MKHRVILSTLVAIFATTLCAFGQWEYPFEYVEPEAAEVALAKPEMTEREALPAHRAIVHYPTREAMMSDAQGEMLIELGNWHIEQMEGGRTRHTARFKRNYKYDDRQLVLRIEGADGAVSVAVNDAEVGYSAQTAGRVEFDLTKALKENHNTISITLHSDYAARAIEASRTPQGKFLSAHLVASPRVAVYDFVTATTFNAAGDGLLNLGVVMQSYLLNSKEYHIHYELHSPEGEVLSKGDKKLTTRMLSRDTVSFFARVPKVKRWSPTEPNLYRIVVYTKHETRIKEFAQIEFGFRTAELKDGGLMLNGSPVEIKATECNWTESAERTSELLSEAKAQGYNLVAPRYPQPEEFYTLCDRLGLMVCDQADIDCSGSQAKGSPSNTPAWKSAYLERAQRMYYSSKGHPSVVMFSLARNAHNGICLYESYLAMKALPKEPRPMVYPEAGGQWNSDL